MASSPTGPGRVGWMDLTVPDAEGVRAFYEGVVGWTASAVEMGGYCDYGVAPPGEATPVGGICHARRANAARPPVWMIYLYVADLDASRAACVERGGAVLDGPRGAGSSGRFAAIRDPAGAVLALFEPTAT